MCRRTGFAIIAFFAAFTLLAAVPASAQFGKLKDRAKKEAEKTADKAIDKTIDGATEGDAPAEAPAAEQPAEAGQAPAADAPGAPGATKAAEDMTLYTKFDFVPGDKVLFYDDQSRDEMGEFPSRWNLDHGVFEIAKAESHTWILCSDQGVISPKITPGPLPDKYTVEMEFFSNGDKDGWYSIHWLDAAGEHCGVLQIGYSYLTSLEIMNKRLADKEITLLPHGRHVMRIMATKSTIKCYVDQERLANVPRVEGFAPVGFAIEMNPYFEDTGITRIGTFRYAEGGKTMKEQLDEAGRIVTHGILFDSGSDRIKAESYKTLTDIGALLTDNPALRLSIEGHTDADGADADNLTLSQARANSVRAYLTAKHGIDAARLETNGWGEGQPLDRNDSAEGKANNRRVELVKL